MLRATQGFMLAALLATNTIQAGGSGLNLIVVVNQNSADSLQLGNDYCELRGVPPQNLLRLTGWTGGVVSWSRADFETYLLNPLLTMVASRGLTNQAMFVLLSMDIPYRVVDGDDQNSTTSALFYGFKTNGAPVAGYASCSLPDGSSNSYAYSELPFRQTLPSTATTNSFLAMMLTDTNILGAENVLSRSVAADSTGPTQTVYLAKTSDAARNVRFVEFDNAVFENQVAGNFAVNRLDSDATAFTNLLGLLTGLANFSLETNAFVPGALGDSLTSYGGYILESNPQTPALAFLEAGAAGTYGTIVEPCNYTQKFPDPVDYFYQTRGFSLAESYYQSILNPFQGLLLGEPLCAPFARPGHADWSSLTNGTILSGQTTLNVVFTAAATNLPLARADLFVDGAYFQCLTNLPLAGGNVLSVILNGDTINYTVPTNATLATAAAGLASSLNLQTNLTQVLAFPVGDRIELQSLAVTVPGSNISVSASATIGSAADLTAQVTAARPVFLDSIAKGYQVVTIYNSPQLGDWLQFTFTKTNGTQVTLGITNNPPGVTLTDLTQSLVNLINANAALEAADGISAADFMTGDIGGQPAVQFTLYARTPGWPAAQILAVLNSSTNLQTSPAGLNPLTDNRTDLRPRNHLYLSAGKNYLVANVACDTTQMPDGFHQLTAVAYEGTSVATQTRIMRNVWIQNTSLAATLAALPIGSNATLDQQLQFSVTANTTNISRIELFSTGGSVGAATNQAAATFALAAAQLGLGLHPFYALITDQSDHRYQTQPDWIRIIPTISITLAGTPPTLAWSALPGREYDLQSTTNLTATFQTVATLAATNSMIQWPLAPTVGAGFYRVRLDP